ncbi:hypothetical protein MRX96_015537 [Rhipicephalus microplus]
MSGAVKAKFVDLSRMLAGEGRLAQDGIHYLAHTTREVATQLVQETRNFLGLREPHGNRGKPTRRPPPNIGSRVPMPALEIHSPSPEPPKTTSVTTHQGGNQGRCTDHPRANPPRTHPAGLRSKHGTASTFEHTPSTGDEFGSANMGATSGHCTPYEDPVASIQAQRKPRAVSNGWGNGPPANDAPNNNAESNHPMILKSRRRHHHRKRTTTNGGFRTGCMSPPPRRGMYLPSKSVERVAKDFESSPQRRESRSYSEFMRALDAVMRTQMVQERPGRRPQNPWWDKEVEVAWKERRQANREHRRFVKGLDTEMEAATMGGGRYAVAATKRRLTEWWATIRRT